MWARLRSDEIRSASEQGPLLTLAVMVHTGLWEIHGGNWVHGSMIVRMVHESYPVNYCVSISSVRTMWVKLYELEPYHLVDNSLEHAGNVAKSSNARVSNDHTCYGLSPLCASPDPLRWSPHPSTNSPRQVSDQLTYVRRRRFRTEIKWPTILLGFHCNILCRISLIFKSYIFTAQKRRFYFFLHNISMIFYHYKIVLIAFRHWNTQYFIIINRIK